MKKEVIKCDFCGKEINRDEESSYYEIHYKNTLGWTTFSRAMSDFEVSKEIFNGCAKKRKINWKENTTFLIN